MKTVYYSSLVRWEVVDKIVFLTEPHEHSQTRELIIKTLDHAVLEAVLHSIDAEHHEDFLQKCYESYHDDSLIDWLEQHRPDIREKLQTVIQKTKEEIREILLSETESITA